MSKAIDDVVAERARQISEEGWTPEHDDSYDDCALSKAAVCYALCDPTMYWPWSKHWWKPKDRRRDLVRAAALLIAEIERLDRQAEKEQAK